MSSVKTRGVHHVGLTVANLAEARAFFQDVLGFEQLGEVPDYPATFLTDGGTMITLWQAEDPAEAVPFDRRKNIGLHHLALSVGSEDELAALARDLGTHDNIDIEFGPEDLGQTGIRHMMCRIPGNIRLELIAA